MDRPRILFVDDDQAVLDGLRDLLRRDRNRWQMVFAIGGEQGLAELEKAPYQVVVSDMRMPKMDGADFLERVKAKYPEVARIILSGHADREAILRTMPVAHQYLSKPSEAEALRTALARAADLHGVLSNPAIRGIVGKLDKLPSVPSTYLELTTLASDKSKGIPEFAAVIERDPAMAAKVLQLVNSAFFGIAQRVSSISKAVTYLGIELIKGLALTANVFGATDRQGTGGLSLDRLRDCSLFAAKMARRFLADPKAGEEAFTSSLLRDVGMVVLADGLKEKYQEVANTMAATGSTRHAAETAVFGAHHAQVGAYLLAVWGLPFSIVEAVGHHHEPNPNAEGPVGLLAAVHVAGALADAAFGLDGVGTHPPRFHEPFVSRPDVASELPRWRGIAGEEAKRAGIDLAGGGTKS